MPAESVSLARVDVIEPFQMLSATYVRQRFVPHTHEEYAIGVVESGSTRSWCRGEGTVHYPGTVITINPGEVHAGEGAGDDGWGYRMFYPSVRLMSAIAADVAPDLSMEPQFRRPSLNDPGLAARLLRLGRLLETRCDPLFHESALVEVMGDLLMVHASARYVAPVSSTRRPVRAVLRVKEFLEAEYARGIGLDELAAIAGMSRFHLIRTFGRVVGMPPYRYLEFVRVRRARDFIAAGHPLAKVVGMTGFSDQSHMTRLFKRVHGVTPGLFARSISANGLAITRTWRGDAVASTRRLA